MSATRSQTRPSKRWASIVDAREHGVASRLRSMSRLLRTTTHVARRRSSQTPHLSSTLPMHTTKTRPTMLAGHHTPHRCPLDVVAASTKRRWRWLQPRRHRRRRPREHDGREIQSAESITTFWVQIMAAARVVEKVYTSISTRLIGAIGL